ncbi:hypothetical protein NPIL_491101, partial [Nephila pilipes]
MTFPLVVQKPTSIKTVHEKRGIDESLSKPGYPLALGNRRGLALSATFRYLEEQEVSEE